VLAGGYHAHLENCCSRRRDKRSIKLVAAIAHHGSRGHSSRSRYRSHNKLPPTNSTYLAACFQFTGEVRYRQETRDRTLGAVPHDRLVRHLDRAPMRATPQKHPMKCARTPDLVSA
jgi:hypothetical protein